MRSPVRASLAAVVAAALVLWAGAAAYGAWSATRAIPPVTVQSGDFGVTASSHVVRDTDVSRGDPGRGC